MSCFSEERRTQLIFAELLAMMPLALKFMQLLAEARAESLKLEPSIKESAVSCLVSGKGIALFSTGMNAQEQHGQIYHKTKTNSKSKNLHIFHYTHGLLIYNRVKLLFIIGLLIYVFTFKNLRPF
jgi:hypothetical protein